MSGKDGLMAITTGVRSRCKMKHVQVVPVLHCSFLLVAAVLGAAFGTKPNIL